MKPRLVGDAMTTGGNDERKASKADKTSASDHGLVTDQIPEALKVEVTAIPKVATGGFQRYCTRWPTDLARWAHCG